MINMKKLIAFVLVVAIMFAFGIGANAQQVGQAGSDLMVLLRPPTQNEIDALVQQLQLTDEQRVQLQNTYVQYTQELQRLTSSYQTARQNLAATLQGTSDPAQVENALEELHRLHSSIISREMQLWNALSNNLTQEQTEKFWQVFGQSRVTGPATTPAPAPEGFLR
ncbi:MAG: hypothetical protein C4520_00425 [Candidatus Abyssobacteria bacterium SURF_5]|uniref:Periplasmic heavy metal sensor n=1 Tax=Abyssobacteria bacterium (strain SURF_5) TaxID=2093360 RepID=A0A3A4P6F9_ABYX5|nr:MAG: hypothetical protein C4520_00425 [Candidatus Abyssubacteria bacterium SURF_5]